MANKEQLVILKQGVDAWNEWRAKNIYVYADLNGADLAGGDLSRADLRISHLRRADLFRANLSGANLAGADLNDANLREANLSEADLTKANLNGANLGGAFAKDADLSGANLLAADLRNADLRHANLTEANLMVANLGGVDVSGANLSKSNLTNAYLSGAKLWRADLSGARLARTNLSKSDLVETRLIDTDLTDTNFTEARLGITVFANSDLSHVTGLESVEHGGPSHLSFNTFLLSAGKIPEVFLRGCGLRDADIEFTKLSNPGLSSEEINKVLQKIHALRTTQALQTSPLFISYSHTESPFVDKLASKLTEKGIRYWREAHPTKAGKMEEKMARPMHQHPRILLILSERSIKNNWIEHEIEEVVKQEKETGRDIVCLAALDSSWTSARWSKQIIMEQLTGYNVIDFSAWKDKSRFEDSFRTLIDGLELFKRE